jgi:hypothetical protein
VIRLFVVVVGAEIQVLVDVRTEALVGSAAQARVSESA